MNYEFGIKEIRTIKEALESSNLPWNEAEIIVSSLLRKDRSYLYTHQDEILSEQFTSTIQKAFFRRQNLEPIQYITNLAHFYGLEFYVDKRVLIPRPATEELVAETIKHILRHTAKDQGSGFHPFPSRYRIVDVGTGSGNIAISLSKHLPKAEILAIDISEEALEVAKINAQKHNSLSIKFYQGDLLDPLFNQGFTLNSIDLIVANLPYISAHFYPTLEKQVKDFEPKIALFGGPTGQALYEKLFKQSKTLLKKGGVIFYELNGQCLVAN